MNDDLGARAGRADLDGDFVCSQCETVLEGDRERCINCDAPRPLDDGWARVIDHPDPWLGRTLDDRYTLVQPLGDGVSGSVYRATRSHLDQSFAVKLIDLRNKLSFEGTSDVRDRIEREVRIMSRSTSPHVVDFHDLFAPSEMTLAVVMDCVEGRTLHDAIEQRGRLEIGRTIQIGLDVASGLRDLHRRGTIHRDLKPANVMLSHSGGHDTCAVIIDFGIARLVEECSQTTGFVGTPLYASPEQARLEEVDMRSDLYSLGMMLFHVLVGRPAFIYRDITRLLSAHDEEPAPSIDEAAPERAFPEPLVRLIDALLAKKPAQRPKSALQVVRWLKRCREAIGSSTSSTSNSRAAVSSESSSEAPGAWRRDAPPFAPSPASGTRPGLGETASAPRTREETSDADDEKCRRKAGFLVARIDGRGRAAIKCLDEPEPTWQPLETDGSVVGLAVSSGANEVVAIARREGTINLFESPRLAGTPTRRIECDSSPRALQLSEDGHVLAAIFEQRAELYAVTTGEHLSSIERETYDLERRLG